MSSYFYHRFESCPDYHVNPQRQETGDSSESTSNIVRWRIGDVTDHKGDSRFDSCPDYNERILLRKEFLKLKCFSAVTVARLVLGTSVERRVGSSPT